MTDADREHVRIQLIADEGLRLHAYQDHLGYWTIGVGRLIDQRRGGGITASEAYVLLDNDINRAMADLSERWPWFLDLDPVRQAVLINLRFNLGMAGLATFKNTLASFQRRDYPAVARGLKASKWFKQVQPSRSGRLIEMVLSGEWPVHS